MTAPSTLGIVHDAAGDDVASLTVGEHNGYVTLTLRHVRTPGAANTIRLDLAAAAMVTRFVMQGAVKAVDSGAGISPDAAARVLDEFAALERMATTPREEPPPLPLLHDMLTRLPHEDK